MVRRLVPPRDEVTIAKVEPERKKNMQTAKPVFDNTVPDQLRETGSAGETAGAGNVDKIRDILFGSQMKDYDTRFRRLEESLLNQTAEIRETSRRRADAFESYVKRELEALQSRLKAERDERSESIKLQSRELHDLGETLQQKLRDMEDRSSENDRGLREQLLQQSKDLLDEMRARQNEMASLVERRSEDLNASKTDRAMLAALFTEVAMRLNDEFKIPGTEG
jgi:hypothetical protein